MNRSTHRFMSTLIEAHVKLKHTFPTLNADKLTQDTYARVQYEYEKLARTSGYANKAYEKKVEDVTEVRREEQPKQLQRADGQLSSRFC